MYKMKWFFVLIIVLSLPVTATAQTSLKRLPSGGPGVGIGFGVFASSPRFSGTLEYGVSDRTKAVLQLGVEYTNDDELEKLGDISSSPIGSIQIGNVKSMPSGFEIFTSGGFGVGFVDVVDASSADVVKASRRDVNIGCGFSILKRIATESAWVFKPYSGLGVDALWESTDIDDETESDVSGAVNVRLGLETEISPSFSVLTGFVFSVENTETVFHIGINFHKPSTEQQD